MGYLRLQDYYNFRIQEQQLTQITQSNDFVRLACELESRAEMISYLVQRYDIDDEFQEIKSFVNNGRYNANDLIELTATAYSSTATYTLNSTCLNNGNVYVCTTAITTPETFNPTKWQLVGANNALYYVQSPYPRYSYSTQYKKGDIVFYKNYVYQCLTDVKNVMPTDVNIASKYWSNGVSYSFTGYNCYQNPLDFTSWNTSVIYGELEIVNYNQQLYYCVKDNVLNVVPGTDINSWLPITWIKGDNRSQQLVAFLIDIVLYKIHMRIAPNNIPQLRKDNYVYCLDWLKEAGGQNNAITANIPLLQPKQGARIRWGSNPKNYNNY
jgi:hypothetical protein